MYIFIDHCWQLTGNWQLPSSPRTPAHCVPIPFYIVIPTLLIQLGARAPRRGAGRRANTKNEPLPFLFPFPFFLTTMVLVMKRPGALQACAIASLLSSACLLSLVVGEAGGEDGEHPDPNDEHYSGMIYIGRMDGDGRRTGFHVDNGNAASYLYRSASPHSIRLLMLTLPPSIARCRHQVHLRHRIRRNAQGNRGDGPAPRALRAGLRPRRARSSAWQDAGADNARKTTGGAGLVEGT